MKNLVGLDKKKVEKLVKELNILLANYELFYQNLRGLLGISKVKISLNCI
ncbi:hypothetical protein MASR2M41_21220 [Flammeovirgaceae bacterium]